VVELVRPDALDEREHGVEVGDAHQTTRTASRGRSSKVPRDLEELRLASA
jgi:hypothetical protein